MGRKLYAKGEGFNPTTGIDDVEGLREELDALKKNSGGGDGDNTTIERRLATAEGEIDDLQRDVAELSEEVAAVGAKVNTLQGTDTGKSVRAIAAEETAKIVGGAPANYDTLKEIADYISSDAEGAAELRNKVNKNATDITDLQSTKASKTEAQGYATTAKNEAIAAAAADAQEKANTAESNAKTYVDNNKLGKTEKAADSAKLGGRLPDYYSPKEGSWYFNESITAEMGWCTVAKYPTTTPLQPRGKFKFLLVTTGGSYTPLVEEYEGDISWNAENCYFARNIGYSQYTNGIRLVNDGSHTHLQVYFRRAFSGIVNVPYNCFVACTTNQRWQWQSGALVKSDVENGVVGADFGNTNGYSTDRAVQAVEGFVGDLQGTANNANYVKITGNIETSVSFPLLMTNNGSVGTVRYDTIFLGKVNNPKYNPSTGALSANKFIGSLQGNADSATKLATARKIWGQSFDGTGDVSGGMTLGNNANIYMTDASGQIRSVMYYATSNILNIGYGSSTANHSTYINGQTLRFRVSSAHTEAMEILANGNVGIGTTNPSEKLDVEGNIKASGTMTATTLQGNLNGTIQKGLRDDNLYLLGIAKEAGSSAKPYTTTLVSINNGVLTIKGLRVEGDVEITGNTVIQGRLTSGASYQANPLATTSEEGDTPTVEQQLRAQISSLEERIATLERIIAQNNG